MLAKLFSEFKEFGALKSENNEDSIDSIKHSAMIEIESEKPKKKEEVKQKHKRARTSVMDQGDVYIQKMQQREAL